MPDLPLEALPIPQPLITRVATRYSVEATELGPQLATVYADLIDGADAITTYYATTEAPPPVPTPDGLGELLYITPPVWTQLPTQVPETLRDPIQATYTTYARSLGATETHLARYDLLLVPAHPVAALHRAGLSPRQSMVQTLRDRGHTQQAIADNLGIATNTVKVHCHRIDQKVSAANRLLDLVET